VLPARVPERATLTASQSTRVQIARVRVRSNVLQAEARAHIHLRHYGGRVFVAATASNFVLGDPHKKGNA